MMLRASQKFQRITDERELLDELGNELVELLGRSVTLYSAGKTLGDPLFFRARDDTHDEAFYTTPDEYAVAAWVFKNRKHAGATTGNAAEREVPVPCGAQSGRGSSGGGHFAGGRRHAGLL